MSDNQDQFTILVVDDEQFILDFIQEFFSRSDYLVLVANSGKEALSILGKRRIDLLLLDLMMPIMGGIEVLREARVLVPDLKVIIQTGYGGIDEAVEAIKEGASDFLEKEGAPEILRSRVKQIYDSWLLERDIRAMKRSSSGTFCYEKMIGDSLPMAKLKEMIVRVAPTDTTVLLQGESGTGKEIMAQAIHHHSFRAEHPFVPVDCASLSETVIESELFGHVKGAFTGAETATLGLIRSADKGTLFLDEIGELSLTVQSTLLRTIQERVVRPVGSTRNHEVDIRIIAATNRNLLDELKKKRFRQDLYWRLSTVTLSAPPLRERKDDLEQLAQHIIANSIPARSGAVTISEQALELIRRYDWPGNVRELENVLRGALVFAENSVINVTDLPPFLQDTMGEQNSGSKKAGTLASYELEAIKNALSQAKNNRRQAAKILDIAEATLYRKIKQYNL